MVRKVIRTPSEPFLQNGNAGDFRPGAGSHPRRDSLGRPNTQALLQSGQGNTVDFDTKEGGLHNMSKGVVKHMRSPMKAWNDPDISNWEMADELFALFLAACTCGGFVLEMFNHFLVLCKGFVSYLPFIGRYFGFDEPVLPSAVTLAKFSGDVVLGVAIVAIVLMWCTLSYKSPWVHTFWQGKYTKMFTPSLMPGGFAPRPTAISLGLLMFVTSTILKEDVFAGKKLLATDVESNQIPIQEHEGCRAVGMETTDAKQHWLFRFTRRHGPADDFFTCYNVNQTDLFGYLFSAGIFTYDDISNMSAPYDRLEHPMNSSYRPAGIMGQVQSWIGDELDISKHGGINNTSNTTWECKYQCIKWQSVGIRSLLGSVSVLLVGCATVTKFTDLLSQNFGGKWIGGQFVSEETSSQDIVGILQRTIRMDCLPQSRTGCFIVLMAAFLVPLFVVAPRISLDNYYSVDYWVSAVFLASLTIALILRRWNPYQNAPMVYTRKLWQNGEDMFVKIDPPHNTEYVKIDLYQWFHLSIKQRNRHLFKYARQVGAGDIDKEIKRQENERSRCLSVKLLKGKEELQDKLSVLGVSIGELDGVFVWEEPKKKEKDKEGKLKKTDKHDTGVMGIYKHHAWQEGKGGIFLQHSEDRNKWQMIKASPGEDPDPHIPTHHKILFQCHSKTIPTHDKKTGMHGAPPRFSGMWKLEGGKSGEDLAIDMIPAANVNDKIAAGFPLNKQAPYYFRREEAEGVIDKVFYDPAHHPKDNKKHSEDCLMVMTLNDIKSVEWEDDSTSNVIRKKTTKIAKGTHGVIIAKKSQTEVLIQWSKGELVHFPSGGEESGRAKCRFLAPAKLVDLMKVGKEWKEACKKLSDKDSELKTQATKSKDDLEVNIPDEPETKALETLPSCYEGYEDSAE